MTDNSNTPFIIKPSPHIINKDEILKKYNNFSSSSPVLQARRRHSANYKTPKTTEFTRPHSAPPPPPLPPPPLPKPSQRNPSSSSQYIGGGQKVTFIRAGKKYTRKVSLNNNGTRVVKINGAMVHVSKLNLV
uniref:Uncharacterized protein n=1 Tax=viral metagenome TaxID=1070528 RepID=A0A6C0KUK2_9ZZZZ